MCFEATVLLSNVLSVSDVENIHLDDGGEALANVYWGLFSADNFSLV